MDSVLKFILENLLYSTVLQSFQQAQKEGALNNVELKLGKKTKLVNSKVPLAFIIGDIQGVIIFVEGLLIMVRKPEEFVGCVMLHLQHIPAKKCTIATFW